MRRPEKVAALLTMETYWEMWPQIPWVELEASSVPLPHLDPYGSATSTLVLMHKRRVPAEALAGDLPVPTCGLCFEALRGPKPWMPKFALANFLWLGRHPPLLRDTTLGHQLCSRWGVWYLRKCICPAKGATRVRGITA